MLLGALAMMLLNFSGQAAMTRPVGYDLIVRAEMIGQRVGMALMAICLLCLIYAVCIFHWRHIGVAGRKDDDRYFDRIGPTILTLGLLGTYSINVILTILVTNSLDPGYAPTVFYYANNNNINVGMNPNQAAPVRPNFGFPLSPVFDTPRLPPGSIILVDSNDDDEDMSHEYKPGVEDDSDNSQPSTDSSSTEPPSSSAALTPEDSSLSDGTDSSTENTSGQTGDQDD
ncbi:hypothetical protein BG003_001534 [Podila horticola]|nr:hypothetical protein BG003_001534 [Podila horticola]